MDRASAVLLAAIFLAMGGSVTAGADEEPLASRELPRIVAADTSLSAEACRAWARDLERRISLGGCLDAMPELDWKAISARVAKPRLSPGELKAFEAGIREKAQELGQRVWMPVCSDIAAGATFRFVGLRQEGRLQVALFRLLLAEGGFNYFGFLLGQDPSGRVAVKDLYIAASGENLSETIGRVTSSLLAQQGRKKGATSLDPSRAGSLASIDRAMALGREGRWQEALDLMDALPEDLLHQKWCLRLRIAFATRLGGERYSRLAEEVQRRFPGEVCFDMVSLDLWVDQKAYDQVFAALGRLRGLVGADPFLDAFEAKVRILKGDLAPAEELLRKALGADPDLAFTHWVRLDLELARKDFAAVTATLWALEHRLGITLGDLERVPAFSEYVKSDDYVRWQQARKAGSTPAARP